MAVTYSQFINPMYFFVDNTGRPLNYGFVFFYRADDHSTFKAIYKVVPTTSSPGVEWPNPLPLNSAGFQGDNYAIYGADDEMYYIEVRASEDPTSELILSVDDYSPGGGGGGTPSGGGDNENLLINSQFTYYYKNYNVLNASLPLLIPNVAPGDWFFEKNNVSANDELRFDNFVPGQVAVPENPVHYLHYVCNTPGSAESFKRFGVRFPATPDFPGSGVSNFAGKTVTLQFVGQSTLSSQIVISLTQFPGSGGGAPVITQIATLALPTTWPDGPQIYTFTVPSITGMNVGPNGDDYFAITLELPLNQSADVQMTNFKLELSDTVTAFEADTIQELQYQSVGLQFPVVTNTPNNDDGNYSLILRKGHQKLSLQSCAGRIIELGYALKTGLEEILDFLKCDGSPIYSQDYYNLTKAISTNWGIGLSGFYSTSTQGVRIQVNTTGATTASQDVNTGMKVYQVTNAASYDSITQILTIAGSQIKNSSYFFFSTTTVNYYFWFNLNSTGTNPSPAGRTGIVINYTGTETAAQIAALISTAASSIASTQIATDTLYINCVSNGNVTPISSGTSGFNVAQLSPGSSADQAFASVQVVSLPTAGSYFLINSPTTNYYVWFSQDNLTSSPGSIAALAGKIGIKVIFKSSDTLSDFLANMAQQLINAQVLLPSLQGLFTRGVAHGSTHDPDRNSRTSVAQGANAGDNVGSYQASQNISHSHDAVAYQTAGGASNAFGTGQINSAQSPVPGVPNDPNGIRQSGGNQSNPNNVYVEKVILF